MAVQVKIGTTDVTEFVNYQDYKMQKQDVVTSWTDGNWRDRQTIARTRISGTFKVGFRTVTDFESFLALLAANRDPDEGFYDMTVYVSNTGEIAQIDAYLELVGEAKWDLVNGRQWIVQTISVEER